MKPSAPWWPEQSSHQCPCKVLKSSINGKVTKLDVNRNCWPPSEQKTGRKSSSPCWCQSEPKTYQATNYSIVILCVVTTNPWWRATPRCSANRFSGPELFSQLFLLLIKLTKIELNLSGQLLVCCHNIYDKRMGCEMCWQLTCYVNMVNETFLIEIINMQYYASVIIMFTCEYFVK